MRSYSMVDRPQLYETMFSQPEFGSHHDYQTAHPLSRSSDNVRYPCSIGLFGYHQPDDFPSLSRNGSVLHSVVREALVAHDELWGQT